MPPREGRVLVRKDLLTDYALQSILIYDNTFSCQRTDQASSSNDSDVKMKSRRTLWPGSQNVVKTALCTYERCISFEKENPRKRSAFGGLASPARFERAAFRLGFVFRQSVNYALKH